MEGFGKRLENLRDTFGYSKRNLSRQLGFSANVYGAYEREERRPSFETMTKIADIYGVSLDYLIRGEEAPQEEPSSLTENTCNQVIEHFTKNGITEPYILDSEKWAVLSKDDLVELSNHFDWVVYKAEMKGK